MYKGHTVAIRDKKIVVESYEPLLMIIHESYRHVCWLMKPVTLQQCKRFLWQDMPLNVLVGVEVGMSVKVSCACFSACHVNMYRYGWDGTGFDGMGS